MMNDEIKAFGFYFIIHHSSFILNRTWLVKAYS